MKKIKNILLLSILALAFSSCNKCKECSNEYNDGVGEPMTEVCRDAFDSNNDYKDFIDFLESEGGYECKSDFWN